MTGFYCSEMFLIVYSNHFAKISEKKFIYVLNPFSKYSMNPSSDEKSNINTSCGREEVGIW